MPDTVPRASQHTSPRNPRRSAEGSVTGSPNLSTTDVVEQTLSALGAFLCDTGVWQPPWLPPARCQWYPLLWQPQVCSDMGKGPLGAGSPVENLGA